MLTSINLSEYEDPLLYDLENQDSEQDEIYLLGLAQKLNGPVLELGCGTGRITIPLAKNGVDITGLDVVPEMLARARQKAAGLPIQWIEADARAFHLPRRFRLIFETGSVFMHMLERCDQEAFLGCIYEHLEEDGRFVFGVMFPHAAMLVSEADEKDWYTYQDEAGRTVRVSGNEIYDPLRQVKLETAFRRWTDENGAEVERVAPLSLRYTFPRELETLLHYNGLEILEQYGGWDQAPLTQESQLIISVCRRRSR